MDKKIISPKEHVEALLKEMKEIFCDENFNLDTDLDILLKKKNEDPIDPFTTSNTMLTLGFDKKDVMDVFVK